MGSYNDDQEQKRILATNLTYFIELSGKNQKTIAIDLDVNPPTFNQWATGKAVPSVSMLKRIAAYFNCTLSALVDKQNANDKITISPAEKELILKYRLAPLSIKETINILLDYKKEG